MKNLFFKVCSLTLLLSLATALGAQEQNPGSAGQTDGTGQEQTPDTGAAPAMADERVSAPALINGQITNLEFTTELQRSNYLRLGIGFGANYDDNALNSPDHRIGDFGYSVMPRIAIDQARERLHWVLDYAAGFTANQRIAERNQASHQLAGSLEYRLAPHADLHLREQFSLTTGFLDQLQGIGNPETGTINQPNPSGITPLSRTQSNLTSADVDYQFTAGDMIGGGGTFGDMRFHDAPAGSLLINTRTYTGNAFYSHRITPKNWTGIAYQYQKLDFEPIEHTSTNSFLLFDTIYLRPRMTFSLFAGPEYSQVDSQTTEVLITIPVVSMAVVETSRQTWSVSGGASFAWQGEHNSLRFNAVRRITDGGGLLGSVLLNTVNGAYRRQLAPATAVSLGGIFGNNHALGSEISSAASYNSVSASLGLEQRLFARLMMNLGYAREYQKINTPLAPSEVNHNRGWVSISYNFERPLGR